MYVIPGPDGTQEAKGETLKQNYAFWIWWCCWNNEKRSRGSQKKESWHFLTNATCHQAWQGTAYPWTFSFPVQLISFSGMVGFLTSAHFTWEGSSEYNQSFPILLWSVPTPGKDKPESHAILFPKSRNLSLLPTSLLVNIFESIRSLFFLPLPFLDLAY